MNVNRIEGSLWHVRLPQQEKQQSTKTARFTQLMEQTAEVSDDEVKKPVLIQQKQRYRLLNRGVTGLICEVETQEGKTSLKLRVPQRDLYHQLKHFTAWLKDGLLAAGHNVTLEVVYDADLC